MGKSFFRQAVKMGDEAVQLSSQTFALHFVGDSLFVAADTGLFVQVVKLRGGADQASSPPDNGAKSA